MLPLSAGAFRRAGWRIRFASAANALAAISLRPPPMGLALGLGLELGHISPAYLP